MLCFLLSVTSNVVFSVVQSDDPARVQRTMLPSLGATCRIALSLRPIACSCRKAGDAYQAQKCEEVARMEGRYLENGLLIQLCQRFSACLGE
jgi:hypothetical protein